MKKTFASHLYRRLLLHGFRVFLDIQEMEEGESLTCQIQGAIRSASVHVAIFSPRYAESKWCLDELIFMLESKAPIIPVFYGVKPAELRWTGSRHGVYAESLYNLEKKKTHEDKLRYDSNTIEKWRKALCDVAEISGFDLQEACNGDEGELVERIVQRVLKLIKHTLMSVAKYPTGLNEKVEDFEKTVLLKQQQIGKAHVVGILGMGGIGKTTMAKELFNRKHSDYTRSCFLSDVRENASKTSLILLQSKLLKGLTKLDIQIEHIGEGIQKLKDQLSFFRTLIILDDVDNADQVDALLPLEVKHVLRSDSLILITSRDKNVLARSGVEDSSIYKMTGLSTQHSSELFCLYAFSQRDPLPGFEYLVEDFLRACDGLPLSLIVFGALLYGNNDKSYWEDLRDRILIPGDIQQKLKISYDALNREEQQIFLDISCFLIGKMRDMAIKIWDGSGLKGLLGFQNLQNKCLIEVNNKNFIKMHHHLRDLGRDIAETHGLPLRLWRPTGNLDDLLKQLSGISEVRGISMAPSHVDSDDVQYEMLLSDMPWYKRKSHELFLNRMKLRNSSTHYSGVRRTMLQFLETEDALLERILRRAQSPNLVWLSWSKCPYSSLPSWIPTENLRVLQVAGSELKTLWQGQLQAPLQLRELQIIAPLSEIPKSIGQLTHLQRITIIYLPRLPGQIKLKRLPNEFCQLGLLKTLELRGCSRLMSLPNSFGDLTNLEHINLSGSSNLEILLNSFGSLIRLKYLDLNGCSNLTISNGTFGHISSLEYINLSYCEKIQVLPSQVAHQRSLENLYLRNTKVRELPSAIGNLSYLEILELGSPLLETLPPSMGDLRNLKELTLWNCKELKSLPDSVGPLAQLAKLRVGFCPLREIPFKMDEGEMEVITEARGLRTSSNLDPSIDKYMFRLQHLELFFTKISKVSFPDSAFPNLQHLLIRFAYDLVEVGTLPNTLIQLELIGCCNLRKIEGLCGLPKLQSLNIGKCKQVEQLPGIDKLVSLQVLWAYECVKLKRIAGLAQLTKLRKLDVSDCSELEELEGVEDLRSLEKLHTYGCPQLQWDWRVLEQLRRRLTKEGMLVI